MKPEDMLMIPDDAWFSYGQYTLPVFIWETF